MLTLAGVAVDVGDLVLLDTREAPHRDQIGIWWKVEAISETGFDAVWWEREYVVARRRHVSFASVRGCKKP